MIYNLSKEGIKIFDLFLEFKNLQTLLQQLLNQIRPVKSHQLLPDECSVFVLVPKEEYLLIFLFIYLAGRKYGL